MSLLALAVLAQAAWADTGDVKIKPEKPLPTAKVTFDKTTGHVTVEVIGGWSWPTHGKDCNTDRAGAGVAVAWFDPKDAGNALGASVTIEGTSTPIAVGGVGNSLNAADNVVHPTENDTGANSVADIAKPSEYKSWRGGCGVFTVDKFFKSSEAAKKGETTEGLVAHGNFGQVAPTETDFEGNPFVNPEPKASTALQGAKLVHVYEKAEDVKRICAVMYDVHAGTNPSKNGGVGIPGGEKEVIAGSTGHNTDNGVQGNSGTPTGNSCPAIQILATSIETNAGGPYTLNVTKNANNEITGNDLKDKATLKGGTAAATGTITFKLWEETEVSGHKVCEGKELGKSEVTVTHANGAPPYESGPVHVSKAGTYHWTAEYSGDGKNIGSSTKCGDAGENPRVLEPKIEVTKSPAFQSVFTGGTATFTITVKNTGEVDLTKVTVTDTEAPGCSKEITNNTGEKGVLKVGETVSYQCTKSGLTGPITNVAEACGESGGVTVCGEGTAKVGLAELTSVQDFKPKDAATVKVETGAESPNGTVTFKLFKGGCTGTPIYEAAVAVSNGKARTESSEFLSELIGSTETTGTYNWQISYGGDSHHNGSFTGSCGTEHFTVTNS